MTDLWSLVHREFGPIQTFLTREEAERELEDAVRDEPGWADKLSIEPFSFRNVEHGDPGQFVGSTTTYSDSFFIR